MAMDMFMKFEGIDGESKDDAHGDEIDVLSWSWGCTQSGSFHTGGGGGAGKVNVQDLSFTKYVDSATSPIIMHVCKGKHIPSATLVMRKAGGDPVEYLVIKMKKVLITSYQTGGSGGEDTCTENVTVNFAEFSCHYQKQDDEGAPDGGTKDVEFNVEKNK